METKLPFMWDAAVRATTQERVAEFRYLMDADHNVLIETKRDPTPECATFILNAVNNHESLLRACKTALTTLIASGRDKSATGHILRTAIDAATPSPLTQTEKG